MQGWVAAVMFLTCAGAASPGPGGHPTRVSLASGGQVCASAYEGVNECVPVGVQRYVFEYIVCLSVCVYECMSKNKCA